MYKLIVHLIQPTTINKGGKVRKTNVTNIDLSIMFDYFIDGQMELMEKYISHLKGSGAKKELIQKVENDCEEYLKTSAELSKQFGENFRIDLVHLKLPENAWVNHEKEIIEKARHKRKPLEELVFTKKEKEEFNSDVEKRKKGLDVV